MTIKFRTPIVHKDGRRDFVYQEIKQYDNFPWSDIDLSDREILLGGISGWSRVGDDEMWTGKHIGDKEIYDGDIFKKGDSLYVAKIKEYDDNEWRFDYVHYGWVCEELYKNSEVVPLVDMIDSGSTFIGSRHLNPELLTN